MCVHANHNADTKCVHASHNAGIECVCMQTTMLTQCVHANHNADIECVHANHNADTECVCMQTTTLTLSVCTQTSRKPSTNASQGISTGLPRFMAMTCGIHVGVRTTAITVLYTSATY